jgi:enoyl-CoA hydratase
LKKKFSTVIYETKDTIARITLNRPEKLNAWDFPGQKGLVDDFHSALDLAEEDDDVKVVIIKAAGRAFSSGHDLTTVGFVYGYGTGEKGERRPSQRIRLKVDRKTFDANHRRLFLFPKVTLAQVHGYCLGEGMILMLCCDLAVVAEDSQIGHFDQRMGFAGSGMGTIPILMATVGIKRAMELLLTGKTIDGKEAERIGLVNAAVPIEKLAETTDRLAGLVCLMPRDGIAIGKAHRQLSYESMGLTHGFSQGYITHTLFTNLRWEDDEYNFFKKRREKGARSGFHERDDRYRSVEGK